MNENTYTITEPVLRRLITELKCDDQSRAAFEREKTERIKAYCELLKTTTNKAQILAMLERAESMQFRVREPDLDINQTILRIGMETVETKASEYQTEYDVQAQEWLNNGKFLGWDHPLRRQAEQEVRRYHEYAQTHLPTETEWVGEALSKSRRDTGVTYDRGEQAQERRTCRVRATDRGAEDACSRDVPPDQNRVRGLPLRDHARWVGVVPPKAQVMTELHKELVRVIRPTGSDPFVIAIDPEGVVRVRRKWGRKNKAAEFDLRDLLRRRGNDDPKQIPLPLNERTNR